MTLRSHLLSSATPIDRLSYRAVTAACKAAEGHYRFVPGETADSVFYQWLDSVIAEGDTPCTLLPRS